MADSTGEERDVRALESAYDDAWTSGDLARLLGFFIPDAVIVTPYGDVWKGIPDIEEGLRAVMSQPSRGTHTSTISAVHFLTSDVAIVDGRAVLGAHAAGATEEDHLLLHSFSDVVVKRDDVWRIAHVRAYGFLS
jgi:uncharacterized protein (TIGR02246 family)